jgi:hypothetical protein
MTRIILLLAATALLVSPAAEAFSASFSASGGGYSFSKRAEVREQKRWTLEDWLAQRDRNRMMDLWLAFNSPSPYELMIGGAYSSYKTENDALSDSRSHNSFSGEFAAYAQIFGVSAEYENNTAEKFNDLSGLFNLRVFGNSIQSSYLTLSYGLRTRTYGPNSDLNSTADNIRVGQQFAQAALQLYIRKVFGIDGQYRYYLPMSDSTLGDLKSNEVEGGLFIDFKSFCIFGRWYQEKNQTTAPGATTETNINRTGIKSGIKIFF